MRVLEIEDTVYDIHKLQNERKYENQKKINEIKIGNNVFTGTKNVVKAIEDQMKKELEEYDDEHLSSSPSLQEREFLSKLPKINLTEEERILLLSPTNEEEIFYILSQEVDKDSSPGEDGITYRCMTVFWNFPEYRFLYLKYLNFTREDGSWGLLKKFGVMSINQIFMRKKKVYKSK